MNTQLINARLQALKALINSIPYDENNPRPLEDHIVLDSLDIIRSIERTLPEQSADVSLQDDDEQTDISAEQDATIAKAQQPETEEESDSDQVALRPAWFYYDSDDREIDIRETIDNLAADLDAMGDLISSVDLSMNELSDTTLRRFGCMLMDKSKECRAFSDLISNGGAA